MAVELSPLPFIKDSSYQLPIVLINDSDKLNSLGTCFSQCVWNTNQNFSSATKCVSKGEKQYSTFKTSQNFC